MSITFFPYCLYRHSINLNNKPVCACVWETVLRSILSRIFTSTRFLLSFNSFLSITFFPYCLYRHSINLNNKPVCACVWETVLRSILSRIFTSTRFLLSFNSFLPISFFPYCLYRHSINLNNKPVCACVWETVLRSILSRIFTSTRFLLSFNSFLPISFHTVSIPTISIPT